MHPSAWLATIAFGVPLLAQEPPPKFRSLDFEAANKVYREFVLRPSLFKRTQGRLVLAYSKDPRARDILIKSYRRAEQPRDMVRYLIASITTRVFGAPEHGDALAQWREANKRPGDAWLWYSILTTQAAQGSQQGLEAIAFGKEGFLLRAAALEALAESRDASRDDVLAAALLAQLQALPTSMTERSVLIESCAAILLSRRAFVREDPWRPVCEALIEALADKGCLGRTKVALSRRLAKIFDTPNLGFGPELWRFKLKQSGKPPKSHGNTTAAFFGIQSLGERICYVIDASDSMLERISDEEKKQLATLTGPRKPRPKRDLPVAERLPWHNIRTRFDAVREYLKMSLAELDESKSYAVVLFGTNARPLMSTPKLLPAKTKNLKKTILELDAIVAGAPTTGRPDGVLRGYTNIHGGLLAAFQMTTSGMVRTDEHVSARSLKEGCDTVFLLSDGDATMDNYVTRDAMDDFDRAGDPETRKDMPDQPFLDFYGPYVEWPYKHLTDEVRRLNLFRKAQIHCVGFGEANNDLLDRFARIGLGRVVRITPPQKSGAK